MRRVVKRALGKAVRSLPYSKDGRTVVLCYHSVHPKHPFASASPELFATHLEWIKGKYDCIPFRDCLRHAGNPDNRRTAVAITFDDGHVDNYEYALPILKDHGLTATFFIMVGLVERDEASVRRFQTLRPATDEALEPMTWNHISELHGAGMEVGAHTFSHPNLARLDPGATDYELRHSKEVMEDRLGTDVSTMAYPFGKPRRHFTRQTMEAVRSAGYDMAAAILYRGVRREDSPFAIPRFFMTSDSTDQLEAKISGDWDGYGLWQAKSPMWLARRISPEDFSM